MTTTPMKERLARNQAGRWHDDFDFSLREFDTREAYIEAHWRQFVPGVESDLHEMLKPSEEMQKAGIAALCEHDNVAPAIPFTAMIQYIINESQD